MTTFYNNNGNCSMNKHSKKTKRQKQLNMKTTAGLEQLVAIANDSLTLS